MHTATRLWFTDANVPMQRIVGADESVFDHCVRSFGLVAVRNQIHASSDPCDFLCGSHCCFQH